MTEWFTDISFWMELIEKYQSLGFMIGIGLTALESLLPFLPLFAFVLLNVFAFGMMLGYFYSTLGTILGSLIVYHFFKKIGHRYIHNRLHKYPKLKKLVHWIQNKGFTPVLLLMCFPFAPSSIINISAGLAEMDSKKFTLALIIGKSVMILIISIVGTNVMDILNNPTQGIITLLLFIALYIIAKKIESKLL